MDVVAGEFIDVLNFLLPGFIAAWVFHGLTPFPKPTQFERVIQALILTMFVQVAVTLIGSLALLIGDWKALGEWSRQAQLTWSVLLALSLGLALARWSSHDTVHARLRNWEFTSLTSYPSEWFSEFARNQGYVVLHLQGERRLYGWPEFWPTTPTEGQFSIAEAEWLVDDDRVPLAGVRNILIPVDQVEMVEFMEVLSTQEAEQPHGNTEA